MLLFFFLDNLLILLDSCNMIAQLFNSTAELVMPTGTQTNEANAETQTVKTKISKCPT